MRENRPSGSEGGVALTTPSLPLSELDAVLVASVRNGGSSLRRTRMEPVYSALLGWWLRGGL